MVTNTEPTAVGKEQAQPDSSVTPPQAQPPPQETRPISCLRTHQLNIDIYCDQPSEDLMQSILAHGVLEPVVITPEGRIVSGHRRVAAAANAGLLEVPVRVLHSADSLEIEELLIQYNRQRQKTNEQLAREAQHLMRIERERAKRRQATSAKGSLGGKALPATSPGGVDARDVAARVLGVGSKKLAEAAFVAETLDRLKAEGQREQFLKLRSDLNTKSVHRAFEVAKALSPEGTPVLSGADDAACVLLSAWDKMTPEEKSAILSAPRKPLTFNEQTGDSIDWARYSWNPLSGCLHDCLYCYAHGAAQRFYPHGFAPALYPDRLDTPLHMGSGPKATQDMAYSNVFTVSMGDLFGRWVPREWIDAVLVSIRCAPKWNFLLLTKNPSRLLEFEFPPNAWVGTTVDRQERVELAQQVFPRVKASVKWVSCEPMLERLTFSNLQLFQWVVIGGGSKTSSFPEYFPPRDHVQHLWAQAEAAGVKVFEKSNLLERRREFPDRPSV